MAKRESEYFLSRNNSCGENAEGSKQPQKYNI